MIHFFTKPRVIMAMMVILIIIVIILIIRRSRNSGSSGNSDFWQNPVNGTIGDKFGERIHPITGLKQFHNGIDISAPKGTLIVSPRNGVVDNIWKDDLSGNAIKIVHDNGYITGFAHLDSISVSDGAMIKKGQVIGMVGTTGRSTGPHLHLTLRDPQMKAIDPQSKMY